MIEKGTSCYLYKATRDNSKRIYHRTKHRACVAAAKQAQRQKSGGRSFGASGPCRLRKTQA